MNAPKKSLFTATALVLIIVVLDLAHSDRIMETLRTTLELPSYILLFVTIGPMATVHDASRLLFYLVDFFFYFLLSYVLFSVVDKVARAKPEAHQKGNQNSN